jgi:ABC-type bacteriocin/lantibiotic exporter with double-glycine peptidase domain
VLELRGETVGADMSQVILSQFGEKEVSMLAIKEAAKKWGIRMVGISADFSELARFAGPVILHLRNPEHFAVLLV